MRSFLTVMIMLTVSPITAAATLVCCDPERWGGSVHPLSILTIAFFGLFTVPLWPTYIPAVVLTPWMMGGLASRSWFNRVRLWVLLPTSCFAGAGLGIVVLAPVLLMSSHEPALFFNWMFTGVISGAVTLSTVSCIFRFIKAEPAPIERQSGGSMLPPPIVSGSGEPKAM
jgi:hypothetical protein